jgi:hypothetical protein
MRFFSFEKFYFYFSGKIEILTHIEHSSYNYLIIWAFHLLNFRFAYYKSSFAKGLVGGSLVGRKFLIILSLARYIGEAE